ncbi:MAG: hypothetical protein BWY19_00076 [bacterium ADurb.Bin212]|nr:MAG: hypothetical protein BWY19_00076 [bacterium ADurb.Bin212]
MPLPKVENGQKVSLEVFGWGDNRKVTAKVESFDDDHIYIKDIMSNPAPPSDRAVVTYSSSHASCVMCWNKQGVANQLCEFK